MTPIRNSNLNFPAEGETEQRVHLVNELRLAHKPAPALDTVDTAIQQAVRDRKQAPAARRTPARRLRLRLGAPVVALIALAAGTAAYMHGQSPDVVSAQVVLNRASAAGISATTVSHAVYRLTSSNGRHGTGDVWLEADASGAPVGFSLSQSMSTSGSQKLVSRTLQIGQTIRTYDAPHNLIRTSLATTSDSRRVTMFDAPYVAMHLDQIASHGGVHVLGRKTLSGVPVTVLQTGTGAAADTLYVDSRSYVLRGVDWTANGKAWQARLASHATIPLSRVPATAFRLNAPAGAHVESQASGEFDLLTAMAGACRSTPQGVLNDMRAHLDSTGLQICQDTNPQITAGRLVAALSPAPGLPSKMTYFVSHPVRRLRILNQ